MTDALAWALVHFLWQGAALAGVAWLLMRLTSSASGRYVIGVTTMAAMVIALGATFVSLIPSHVPATVALSSGAPPEAVFESAVPVVGEAAAATFSTAEPAPVAVPFVLPTTWVLSVWAVGVCLLSVRVFGGWCLTRRIARHPGTPVGADVQYLAQRISARLGIRRVVQVVESSRVAVPMMIGWLRPVVLMPPAALSGLSPLQLEAILAHEFAHIRRHDYLVNLLQTVVETTLFFHPAVWWLSREIRSERELCCDDIAVSVCDRLTYATALSALAHIRPPVLALAATDGALRSRVLRIITPSSTESAKGGWMAMLPIALVLMLAAPAAFSSEPPTITVSAVTIAEAQVTDVDDPVVTADPVTNVERVEPTEPTSRPALPVVLDFFMPPVQAAAWQMTPPPAAPNPAPYRVRVGDIVLLQWHNLAPTDSDMNGIYPVGADGTIALKYVGALRVVDKTNGEIQAAVLSAFVPKIYREGTLSVVATVTPPNVGRVTVQGYVNAPGEKRLQRTQMTLSRALTAAGGFSAQAGEEIEIRRSDGRGGVEAIKVTRTQLNAGDDPALLPDDTITVRPRPRDVGPGDTVTVQGWVNRPGEKQLTASQMTLSRALTAAGGFSTQAGEEVEIRRSDSRGGVETIKVTRTQLNAGDDPALLPDDSIVVRPRTRDVGPGDTVTITVRESPPLSGVWVLQADGSLRRTAENTPSASSVPQAAQQAPTSDLVFFVNGEVNNGGQKAWAEGMTVEKAIALAKGMNSRGKLGHIMRPIRDDKGIVLKYERISNIKLDTEIRPDDELVITRRWWGN